MLSRIAALIRGVLAFAALALVLWAFVWVATRAWRQARQHTGQVELRVLHWGDKNEDAIVASIVADFERLNPDIRILRINPGQSALVATKIQTMVAAGDPPDVFYLDYPKVADFASKGLLADVEALIAQDRRDRAQDQINLDDYFPAVLNCFRYDHKARRIGAGTLYGMPKDFTTVGFYYNKDLFRRAGLPEPQADGWTWDEFITAARKIAELPGCYGADFATWEAMVRIYLWTYGLEIASPGFDEFYLDRPEVIARLDQLRGWFFDENRTLASAKTQLETGMEPFLAGNVGLAGPFGRWKVPTYRLIKDFDWDFAPMPHAKGQPPANGIFTTAWSIAAGSRHMAESWRFVKYLSGRRGQELNTLPGLAIPPLKAIAYSHVFVDPDAKPKNDQVYLDAVEWARPIEWPDDPRYLYTLRTRLEGIFKQNKDTAELMRLAQREWVNVRATESDVLKRDYPAMPWAWIAAWILGPLAVVLFVGGARWWITRPGRLDLRDELAGYWLVSPWVIGFIAFTMFPIVMSLLLAFTRWSGLATLDAAEWVALDNWRQLLFHDATFRRALTVTALYALLAVPTSQLVALLAAVLMAQEVRGVGVYRAVWYLPSVLAGVGIAVMWKWVFHHEHGLFNALLDPIAGAINYLSSFVMSNPLSLSPPRWFEKDGDAWGVPAFAIMNLWSVGGTMMIYLAGLKGIPRELYEAAEIDGATGPRRFRHVTLPMLSPVIFFNVIIAIIASFQIFTQAYVMTGGGPEDATRFYVLYLYNQAFDLHAMGYASAMAWLLLLIVLGLTLIIMRASRRFVYYEALKV